MQQTYFSPETEKLLSMYLKKKKLEHEVIRL